MKKTKTKNVPIEIRVGALKEKSVILAEFEEEIALLGYSMIRLLEMGLEAATALESGGTSRPKPPGVPRQEARQRLRAALKAALAVPQNRRVLKELAKR